METKVRHLFKSLGDASDFEKKLIARGVTTEDMERTKNDSVKLNEIATLFRDHYTISSLIAEKLSENEFKLNPYIQDYSKSPKEWVAEPGLDNSVKIHRYNDTRHGKIGVHTLDGMYIIRIVEDGCFSDYLDGKSTKKTIQKMGYSPTPEFPELAPLKLAYDELYATLGSGDIIVLGEKSRMHDDVPSLRLSGDYRGFREHSLKLAANPHTWILVSKTAA